MTANRFQALMGAVAGTLWSGERASLWSAQVAFLSSTEGRAYSSDLTQRLDALKAATGTQ